MIFHEKRIRFIYFLLKKGQNCSNIRDFLEIADEHNFRTKYAETWNVCKNVQFWLLYRIVLITQFQPKVDLGPFGNELLMCLVIQQKLELQEELRYFVKACSFLFTDWNMQKEKKMKHSSFV